MKEERNDYEEENIIELVDDEGNTVRFEHLMTFEYKGEWYIALAEELPAEEPVGDEDEGDEVILYHIVGSEEDEHLEPIESDELLDEVFAEFCHLWEDFEDSDEAEKLDS